MSGLTVGLTVEGAERLSKSLGAIRVRIIPTMTKTARRGIWVHVIEGTKEGVARDSGIGRRIWGQNPVGLTKQRLVVGSKLILGPHAGVTSLLLRGIPALAERGGQIEPHVIRSGFGRTGMRMPHPGMTIRAHNTGQRVMGQNIGKIQKDVDEAIGEMLRRHGF
jgi:hypothetical protein